MQANIDCMTVRYNSPWAHLACHRRRLALSSCSPISPIASWPDYAVRTAEKLAASGRLAQSLAHEINNPLEAITNLLYLAESCGPVQ